MLVSSKHSAQRIKQVVFQDDKKGQRAAHSSCLRRVRGRVRPLPKMIIRYNNYVQAWKIENKLKENYIHYNNTQQLDGIILSGLDK